MDQELRTSADNVIAMLRQAAPEIAKELTGAVRDVARVGADMAKANAAMEGFTPPGRSGRGTGRLIEKIGYTAHGVTGIIKESATRDGYRYPAIYEFSREYKGGRMRRPFLIPARNEIVPYARIRIDEAVREALDKVERDHTR